MLLSNGNLPDLNKYEKSGDKVKALLEYIFTMRQEINHVLCNLDEGNLSKNLRQSIAAGGQQTTVVQKETGGGMQEPMQPETPEEEDQGLTLDDVYPVGSIYMSVGETSPQELFGGIWEKLKDAFLLAAGDAYAAGSTGGESEHTLTVEEMPQHSHGFKVRSGALASGSTYARVASDGSPVDTLITNTGGSKAHNNMPPYIAVNMWKRTA